MRPVGLVAGWLADAVLGDPRCRHPVAGFRAVAARLETLMDADSRAAGVVHTVVLVGAPALATEALRRRLGRRGRVALMAGTTWAALRGKSLATEAAVLAQRIEHGDLPAAQRGLSAWVGSDTSRLGAEGLACAGVERLADHTADAVVAPLLYGALLGPAGVVAHRCSTVLDVMVGHGSERHERFGWAAARFDDLLGWLPSRLTAVLAAAAAPAADGDPREALAVWLRDRHRHPDPNAGQAEAAFAGALGVRLGGAGRYRAVGDARAGARAPTGGMAGEDAPAGGCGSTRIEARGPLGDGDPPTSMDVYRAVRLSRMVSTLAAAVAVALAAALDATTDAMARRAAPQTNGTAPLTSRGRC